MSWNDPDLLAQVAKFTPYAFIVLGVETLLLWANNDPTVPVERGLRLQAMIPGADMHILDRAKHMVMIDQSERFNRLLLAVC